MTASKPSEENPTSLSCGLPHPLPPVITMAHGGGGSVMHGLIEGLFMRVFANQHLAQQTDAATVCVHGGRIAFTTDTFVVQPLEFPGGDIGELAVYGTVNDLAMAGARPLYLSAGFVLEEGLPLGDLERIAASMERAARRAGVQIVTGDTKVIERHGVGGMFINTAGIGVIEHQWELGPRHVRPGDRVLINGDLGRHGMAVMAVREGLEFETPIRSDAAPLAAPVLALLEAGVEIHCLRDLTRGGLASAANEIASVSGFGIALRASDIPVSDSVRGACELLGFDPLYVANEGRFMAVISAKDAAKALDVLSRFAEDTTPAMIGEITESPAGMVTLRSEIGTSRILDMLSGEQLPRIC